MENNLKYYREKVKLSQAKVAQAAKCTTRVYQNYEYGEAAPGVYSAIRIARVLGYPVEELFPLPLEEL